MVRYQGLDGFYEQTRDAGGECGLGERFNEFALTTSGSALPAWLLYSVSHRR